MSPEEQLRYRLATKVMEWKEKHIEGVCGKGGGLGIWFHDGSRTWRLNTIASDPRYDPPLWDPLFDLNLADMVSRKMFTRDLPYYLLVNGDELNFNVIFARHDNIGEATDVMLSMAICLAAIDAVEKET